MMMMMTTAMELWCVATIEAQGRTRAGFAELQAAIVVRTVPETR